MSQRHNRLVFTLGVISTVGPLTTDMYLATFPSIGRSLHAPNSAVQLTMVAYVMALAFGQLIYGPAADMFGRKPPLFAGMALYCLACIGCAFAPNIHTLILMRFFQGLGACSGMVIARAMVRDVFRGADAVRVLSRMMLVISVSPILAPLAGSSIAAFVSWRWVFGVLTGLALTCSSLAFFRLSETLPPESRQPRSFSSVFGGYGRLAREPRFLALTVVVGLGSSTIFSYISGASLLFIQDYGIAPSLFSMVFAANAVGMITMAQFNSGLVRRFGAPALVMTGCILTSLFLVPLAIMTHFGLPPLWVVLPLLVLTFASIGLIQGPATMLAMETQKQGAGSASAALGTLQFGLAATASAIVSALGGDHGGGMFGVMAGCCLAALLICLIVLRRPRAGRLEPIRP